MSDPVERTSLRGLGLRLALLAAVILTVGVLFWFQPQQLFIDERVDDAAPQASTSTEATGDVSPSPAPAPEGDGAPPEVAIGDFISLDHVTSGKARVLDVGEERRVLRLEEFETENGPDLFVYLTTASAEGDDVAYDEDFVNLGRLKGNLGDQNYEIAEGVDLARYATVVIWCDRFNSPFGAADLEAH